MEGNNVPSEDSTEGKVMKKDDLKIGAYVKKGSSADSFKYKGRGMIKAVKHESNHYYCLIHWEQSSVEEWVHANRLIEA